MKAVNEPVRRQHWGAKALSLRGKILGGAQAYSKMLDIFKKEPSKPVELILSEAAAGAELTPNQKEHLTRSIRALKHTNARVERMYAGNSAQILFLLYCQEHHIAYLKHAKVKKIKSAFGIALVVDKQTFNTLAEHKRFESVPGGFADYVQDVPFALLPEGSSKSTLHHEEMHLHDRAVLEGLDDNEIRQMGGAQRRRLFQSTFHALLRGELPAYALHLYLPAIRGEVDKFLKETEKRKWLPDNEKRSIQQIPDAFAKVMWIVHGDELAEIIRATPLVKISRRLDAVAEHLKPQARERAAASLKRSFYYYARAGPELHVVSKTDFDGLEYSIGEKEKADMMRIPRLIKKCSKVLPKRALLLKIRGAPVFELKGVLEKSLGGN